MVLPAHSLFQFNKYTNYHELYEYQALLQETSEILVKCHLSLVLTFNLEFLIYSLFTFYFLLKTAYNYPLIHEL